MGLFRPKDKRPDLTAMGWGPMPDEDNDSGGAIPKIVGDLLGGGKIGDIIGPIDVEVTPVAPTSTDVWTWVEENPWTSLGAAIVAGLILRKLIT